MSENNSGPSPDHDLANKVVVMTGQMTFAFELIQEKIRDLEKRVEAFSEFKYRQESAQSEIASLKNTNFSLSAQLTAQDKKIALLEQQIAANGEGDGKKWGYVAIVVTSLVANILFKIVGGYVSIPSLPQNKSLSSPPQNTARSIDNISLTLFSQLFNRRDRD